jgi:hypothetical protein
MEIDQKGFFDLESHIYALDYFIRRFRFAKKVNTLPLFFYFMKIYPKQLQPQHFLTLKLKNSEILPLLFDLFQALKRST